MKTPSYNTWGSSTAVFCRQHAVDGMVNVRSKRCSHSTCSKIPSFNVRGNITPLYCKQHAEDGMVNVNNTHCLHSSCTRRARWGALTDGAATSCASHKDDIVGGPVINFRAKCEVAGCAKESCWGVDGKQPTRCLDHGPLEDGLIRTVESGRSRVVSRGISYVDVKSSSSRVKTECSF